MIKLSIVIPYYDTYDLTLKLLKELSIQVTDEVEVILVDDGCHEERFDKFISNNIKIIHLAENGHAPHAWNTGIKETTGKYIAFIDSDDTIMMNYVEELIKAIDEHDEDVIMFNWIDINKNTLITEKENKMVLGVWKAIYKREICPMFREEWTFRSDIPFQSDLGKKHPTVYYLNKTLYGYNSGRVGSLTWIRQNEVPHWQPPRS